MKRIYTKDRVLYWMTLSLSLIICLYFANQKVGYHIDELYSYGLANSYSHPFPNAINQWLSGSYYHDYLSADWAHRFNYLAVYQNQVQDVHPPLYYFLLHTISSCVPGIFSKWLGLGLNLVSHLLSLTMIILIGRKMSTQSYIPYALALLWGLSVGGLNTFLFIRMYSLLTCMGLILLYQMICLLDQGHYHLRSWIGLSLTVMLGSLTHYYFIIYAGLLFIFWLVIQLRRSQWNFLIKVGSAGLVGLGLAYLFFPAMISHLTQSNRGSETLTNLRQVGLGQNLLTYLRFINWELLGKMPWGLFLAIFIISVIVYYQKRPYLKHTRSNLTQKLLIIGPALAFFALVQVISHYLTPRYIYLIYPQLILYFAYYPLAAWSSFKDWRKYLTGAVFALMLIFNLYQPTLTYTYPQQFQLNQTINSRPPVNAIVLTDQKWKLIRLTTYLQDYQHVYPWSAKEWSIDSFPQLADHQQSLDIYILDQAFPLSQIKGTLKQVYPDFQSKITYQDQTLTLIHLE